MFPPLSLIDWLKVSDSIALWLEGLALLLIFFWDRKDHKEDHQETIEQMKVMSRNAVATEMAAKAALDSSKATSRGMDILIARERPRITVTMKEPDFSRAKDVGILWVQYEVECWCPTVAFIVSDRVEAYVADPKALIPKIESPIAVGLPTDVRQTTKFDRGALVFNAIVNTDVVDEIASGKSVLYFYGQIKYRGVHLAEGDSPYKTVFRYKWVPDESKSVIPGLDNSRWEKYGNDQDNRET